MPDAFSGSLTPAGRRRPNESDDDGSSGCDAIFMRTSPDAVAIHSRPPQCSGLVVMELTAAPHPSRAARQPRQERFFFVVSSFNKKNERACEDRAFSSGRSTPHAMVVTVASM